MKLGANFHAAWTIYSADKRAWMLDQLVAMGTTSVRVDFEWRSIEPTRGEFRWDKLDAIVNDCAAKGIGVLLMLYSAPTWSSGSAVRNGTPSDGADFGKVCGLAGLRYGTKLDGIELWNEPDLSSFWVTRDPVAFTRMIQRAYPVAKGMAPNTTFVLGSPTYLGLATGWFERCFTAGIKGHYDALAVHPYLSPADLPPDAPASDWSIRGIKQLAALRGTTPLWATEFGWSTHANTGTEANHKRGVSEAQQADYTALAIDELDAQGVERAYVYTDRDMSGNDPHEANFGLFRSDWSPKPVVGALTQKLNPTQALKAEIDRLNRLVESQARMLTASTLETAKAQQALDDLRQRVLEALR